MLTPKPFAYDTTTVSQKQFNEHVKLYEGYVSKINQIDAELEKNPNEKEANATYSKYRCLKKGKSYALNGVILHEAYFQNLGNKKTAPLVRSAEIINQSFDSYENWEKDFIACCKAARGWCIFVYEQRTNSFCNILLDSHDDGMVCLAYPLLVMDMYEHAYFLDYGINKDEYIRNFLDAVDWRVVEKRAEKLNNF